MTLSDPDRNEPEFGLYPASLATVRSILAREPKVETAILYGSRAMGTCKPGSDIDLTLIGPSLDPTSLASLAGALEESSIPYLVDLSLLDRITNPRLLEHIQRVGKVLYRRLPSPQPGSEA